MKTLPKLLTPLILGSSIMLTGCGTSTTYPITLSQVSQVSQVREMNTLTVVEETREVYSLAEAWTEIYDILADQTGETMRIQRILVDVGEILTENYPLVPELAGLSEGLFFAEVTEFHGRRTYEIVTFQGGQVFHNVKESELILVLHTKGDANLNVALIHSDGRVEQGYMKRTNDGFGFIVDSDKTYASTWMRNNPIVLTNTTVSELREQHNALVYILSQGERNQLHILKDEVVSFAGVEGETSHVWNVGDSFLAGYRGINTTVTTATFKEDNYHFRMNYTPLNSARPNYMLPQWVGEESLAGLDVVILTDGTKEITPWHTEFMTYNQATHRVIETLEGLNMFSPDLLVFDIDGKLLDWTDLFGHRAILLFSYAPDYGPYVRQLAGALQLERLRFDY